MKNIIEDLGFGYIFPKLSNALETCLHKDFDNEGFEPSGGIGQKLAISRAVYKDADIILLDEPTAALDPKAESDIYESYEKLTDKKLAFYISHRLSSSKFCDRILVFQDGQIIEQGTHEDLMRDQTVYAELYNIQSKYYNEDKPGEILV
ncbi:ATP-binding cassette domain-containing protein [Ileibacterium valens]|uniref:ATP-binding cassette domain-containing protein n=1 Tax=Ileibacterium valens TaxID=1862668 RepID=UPI0034E56369